MNRATVDDFKRQCQVFDGDRSSEAAHELGRMVEEDLPEEYQVPYERPELVKDQETRHYRGLWHELVQHLTDLGYLTTHEFVTYHKLRKEIPDEPRLLVPVLYAVRQYLTEEEWPELAKMFTSRPAALQLSQLEEHLGAITERIARYTTFDGSLSPPPDYEVGMINCYGRSLAFRLRTLFTLDQDLWKVAVFDQQYLKFLYSFQNLVQRDFLPESIAPEEVRLPKSCWEMLCSIDAIYESFKDARPEGIKEKKIVLAYPLVAKNEIQSGVDESEGEEQENNQRSKRKFKANQQLVNTGYHEMGIRILQIKLWQTHFYVGAVDGKWGEVSHEAVVSLIDQEKDLRPKRNNGKLRRKDRKELEAAYTLTKDENTVMIGFVAMYELLKNYHAKDIPEAGLESDGENDEMSALLIKLNVEHGIPQTQLDESILHGDDINKYYPDALVKPQRRVAFPQRSFLQGIKRGLMRVVNWVKKGIMKLLGPVFGFVKLLLSKVRAGIQQFFRGFRYLAHFLLGRPIITLGTPVEGSTEVDVFATKFNLDFDGVNFVSSQARTEDIERHTAHIRDMKESMFYFIDTTLKIIKVIGRLSQPGGWVWLGWQIARLLVGDLVDVVKTMV